MIPPDTIEFNGTQARLFQCGIRMDYYVTQNGEVISRSNGPLRRLRRLTPCTNGHRYPTIRLKVEESGLVLVRNLPIYRIVYDTWSGRMNDWSIAEVEYVDGNPLNYAFTNMRFRLVGEPDVGKMTEYSRDYERNHKLVSRYITWKFTSICMEDAQDLSSEAFFRLCAKPGLVIMNSFAGLWIKEALSLASHFYRHALKSVFDCDFLSSEPDDLPAFFPRNIYTDFGLSEEEKTVVSLMTKGYTKGEIVQLLGYKYDFQMPVKIRDIAKKINSTIYE